MSRTTNRKSTHAITLLTALLIITACNEEAPRPTREEMMDRKMETNPDSIKPGVDRVDLGQKELRAGLEQGVPEELLDKIRIDAAERGNSTPENVRIISAYSETWADGSMGCPVPGEVYTQMQTTGYHIVAAVGLQKFDYRAGENGRFKLCDPLMNKKLKLEQLPKR